MHALSYSFVGIQTLYLATQYPPIYWNCACLITNSGADDLFVKSLHEQVQDEFEEEVVDIYEPEDTDEYIYEDAPDHKSKKKKKNKTVNFGKIATAIGQFQNNGFALRPPDINSSSYTFSPDSKHNTIVCGLYGLTRISADLVSTIIKNRPYDSIENFLDKVKVNKTQMLTLIKSGAFDSLYPDRMELLKEYVNMIAGTKNNLTLANIPMLIKYNVLPEEAAEYIELYQFNKFIRKRLNKETGTIIFTNKTLEYYSQHFDLDLLISDCEIMVKDWEKQYKAGIAPLSEYIKANKGELLDELNQKIVEEQLEIKVNGNIAHCEMEAMSFYYHPHELSGIDFEQYDVCSFNDLPAEATVENAFNTPDGKTIVMYHLTHIIGTVIDKNKIKNSITLLTPTGVVNVKIWKNQYAKYDKQISSVGPDGKKKVMERSWFKRGTLLYIQGIRRDNNFIPKSYKNSKHRIPIMKILSVDGSEFTYTDKRYDE